MNIQEIEAREKAATPGDYYDSAGDVFQEGTRERIARCTSLSRDRADARFFAQSRTDIRYLLAELREAREKLEAVGDATNDLDGLAQDFKDEGGPKLEVAEAIRAWVTRYNRILKGGD